MSQIQGLQDIAPSLTEDIRDYLNRLERKIEKIQSKIPFLTFQDIETLVKEKYNDRLKCIVTTGRPPPALEDIEEVSLYVAWMSRYPPDCNISMSIRSKYDGKYEVPFYDCWEYTGYSMYKDYSIADGREPNDIFLEEEVWGITRCGGAMTVSGILDRFFDKPLQEFFRDHNIPVYMWIKNSGPRDEARIDLMSVSENTVIRFPQNSDS